MTIALCQATKLETATERLQFVEEDYQRYKARAQMVVKQQSEELEQLGSSATKHAQVQCWRLPALSVPWLAFAVRRAVLFHTRMSLRMLFRPVPQTELNTELFAVDERTRAPQGEMRPAGG